MNSDLYFRCERCGERIVPFDSRNYRAPIHRDSPPLRQVLNLRRKKTGRQLCGACMETWEASHKKDRKDFEDEN